MRRASSLSRPQAIAFLILVAALALRLWDLTARSLWLDEAVEYWVATARLSQLPTTVRDVIQDPPLYSLLLHLWMTGSEHEAWLRLLSVLLGVGGVVGVMVIGYRLQGQTCALAAGALMSIMPTAVRYSQEIGQYAPTHVLVVWSVVMLLAVVRDPSPRRHAGWLVLAVIATYTYYGTVIPVLVPFACALVQAAIKRDRVRVRRGLLTLAAFVGAVLPLLVYFLPHQLRRGPTAHAFEAAAIAPPGEALREAGRSLQMTFSFQFTGWPCTTVPGWLPVVLFGALVVFAWRRQRSLVMWFLATWIVYAGLGWLHLFPIGFRHSNILTGLIVPLAACVLGAGPRLQRAGGTIVFGMLCALCIVSLPNRTMYERIHGAGPCAWPETEDVSKIARYWMDRRTPDQKTYVYYGAAPSFAYYADRLGVERTPRPPDWFQRCWRGDDAPWCREGGIYYGEWIRPMSPDQKMESILATLDGMPGEFWLILAHAQGGENLTIGKYLAQYYETVDYLTASDASAVLVRRRTP